MKPTEPKPATVTQEFPAPADPVELVAVPAEILLQIDATAALAKSFTISDVGEFNRADALCAEIRELRKSLEESRKAAKAPVLELGKSIDAVAKRAGQPLDDAYNILSGRIISYQREQERKRAEIRRAAEEADRKQREERQRKEREAAEAAEVFGQPAPEPTPEPEPAAVAVAPQPEAPKSASVTTRKVYSVAVDDETAIPMDVAGIRLWTLDEKAVLRVLKMGGKVPGCRLVEEERTVGKASR